MGFLDTVTKEAPALPTRLVMYAPEKAGKTSFACYAPSPIFAMSQGETGLLSLIEAGQVPETPHFPSDFGEWENLWTATRELINGAHDYRTLVIDTGNGAENLLAQSICGAQFRGDWKEYQEFGRGVRIAAPAWGAYLALLDEVRVKRKMGIILLYHAAIKPVSNPTGKDFDQYRPEATDKLWSLTHKWADAICFYGTRVTVNKDDKATGEQRFLRCNPSPSICAGNRYGLPDEITAGHGAEALWKAFAAEMKKAKGKAAKPKPSDAPKDPKTGAPPPPPPAATPADEPPELDEDGVPILFGNNPDMPPH